MRVITSRVSTMLQVEDTISITFRYLASQKTIFLLCIYLLDKAFLSFEIKSHRITLICIVTHMKYWCSKYYARSITSTCSMHQGRVHTHIDFLTLQVHILVFYMRVTIKICHTRRGNKNKRIICRELYRRINAILLRFI